MKRLNLSVFFGSLILLSAYSYSQIDLNLTISSNLFYQKIQQQLIYLGYFNRPLSTLIYTALVVVLFTSYLIILKQARAHKFTSQEIIKLSFISVAILFFSYPAFSHDVFNYIFDARILVLHGQNPWTHTALDFPNDLWTRFMRWTHRTYPYGPLWLPLSSVFYHLGFGKFTLTLIMFKLLSTLSYLLATITLNLTLIVKKYKNKPFLLSLFVLNPLILIESLVSSHLDITMAALSLLGIYQLAKNSKTKASISLLASAAIKYVTVSTLPFLPLLFLNKINYKKYLHYSLILTYLLTAYVITQREILPWYFITPFSITPFVDRSLYKKFVIALTPALLLRYVPFLLIGDYTQQVYLYRNVITFSVFIVMMLVLLTFKFPLGNKKVAKK